VIEAVPVVARVEKRERPSGRRGRHVDAQAVGERNGQQRAPQRMVGLILLQLVLRRERQAAQVVERADVGGLDSRGVELPTIERARLIGVLDLLVQPLLLDRAERCPRRRLDVRLQVAGVHGREAYPSRSAGA